MVLLIWVTLFELLFIVVRIITLLILPSIALRPLIMAFRTLIMALRPLIMALRPLIMAFRTLIMAFRPLVLVVLALWLLVGRLRFLALLTLLNPLLVFPLILRFLLLRGL